MLSLHIHLIHATHVSFFRPVGDLGQHGDDDLMREPTTSYRHLNDTICQKETMHAVAFTSPPTRLFMDY